MLAYHLMENHTKPVKFVIFGTANTMYSFIVFFL